MVGIDVSFEGHGVLLVAKETVHSAMPLCLGLGPKKNKVSHYFLLSFSIIFLCSL